MDIGYGSFYEHILFDVVAVLLFAFVISIVVIEAGVLICVSDTGVQVQDQPFELQYGDGRLLEDSFKLSIRETQGI